MTTNNYSQVADYIHKWVKANKVALGLKDVFFGDQDLIDKTPVACVEPGGLTASLAGALFRTDNDLTVFILVYHGKVQDVQLTKKECDDRAVAIQTFLHTDKRLSDVSIDPAAPLVTQGFVTAIEPGYRRRGNTLQVATRITWTGYSKTSI